MTFCRPEALWLLAVVPAIVALELRSRSRGHGTRPAAVAARALAITLAVVALARPAFRSEAAPVTFVLVDASPSAAPASGAEPAWEAVLAELPGDREVRVVRLGREPREVSADPPGSRRFPLPRPGSVAEPVDVDAGLRLVDALLADGRPASVVLVGDGRTDRGSAGEGLRRLARRGVPVDVRTSGRPAPHPVLLPPEAPAALPVGATLRLAVEAEAEAALGPLSASVTGLVPPAPPRPVTLRRAGASRAGSVDLEVSAEGLNVWRVELLDASGAPVPEGRHRVALHGRTAPRIVVVEPAGGAGAAAALADVAGPGLRVLGVPAPDVPGDLDAASVGGVVLADVPAAELGQEAHAFLARVVSEGAGLLVGGGPRSFGPGGFGGTPLAELLPVRSVQREERRDPSATLVVIIDTSGSMGGPRMDLAKEVARLALRRLKPHDKAGIVEFHGARRWAAPVQPASNEVALQRALDRLSAGGGTVILPAIRESFYALLDVRTRIKHVLVITDGGVEQGDFEGLVRRMSEHGITLSTVLVGPSAHGGFLMGLAQWGRGRFYHAPDRFHLPEVIVKQAEGALLPPWSPGGAVEAGADGSWVTRWAAGAGGVPVHTLLDVEPRPTADVLLAAPDGRPLLARWRYGLGLVSAWTTELFGDWTGELRGDPDYGRLLMGLLREGTPELLPGELGIEAAVRGDTVSVLPSGPVGAATRRVTVVLEPEGAAVRTRALDLVGPDLREVPRGPVFAGVPSGVARIAVRDAAGVVRGRAAVAVPGPREWTRRLPDRGRLAGTARRTGGLLDGPLSAPAPAAGVVYVEVWRAALLAALALFLLHVLARRLPRGAAAALVLVLLAPAAPSQEPGLPEGVAELLARAERAAEPAEARAATEEAMLRVLSRDGTLAVLRRHLEDAPQGAGALRVRVLVEARSGRLSAATGLLEAAAGRGALPPDLLAERARLLELSGKDEAAVAAHTEAAAAIDDDAARLVLGLRRAALLLEAGEGEAGLDMLAELRRAGPGELGFPLALLAALHGERGPLLALEDRGGDARRALLVGTFALAEGRHAQAAAAFEAAASRAATRRDRRYALERLVATHRRAGTLDGLATRWMGVERPDAVLRHALVALLRELRRVDDAVALLRRAAGGGADVAADIVGLLLEAGRQDDVEAVYQELIARDPQELAWRSALALTRLLDGRPAEASSVMRGALEHVEDGPAALRVASAALDLALFDAARAAAVRAEQDSRTRIAARLFLARLKGREGDLEGAVAELASAEAGLAADDTARAALAAGYERLGRLADAVRVLLPLQEATRDERLSVRVGWLQRRLRRHGDAVATWRALWERTETPALKLQAETEILELAARSGGLADLVIDLEQRLEGGRGTVDHLRLLVKAYARAEDPVAAIEVLAAYGEAAGQDRVGTLRAMAEVYRTCGLYRRYRDTLQELQQRDPDEAVEYQEQLVLGALDAGRSLAARDAVRRLRGMAAGSERAEQLHAGLLDMLGLEEEAVAAYERVLARHPGQIEVHLLLARALVESARADRARGRLLDLLDRADEDDLFTVAVDGLLNVGGAPDALRVALRRVLERIAFEPHKVFLYDLAADLCEELGDEARRESFIALSAVVGGEQRPTILRELMELAASDGRRDDQVAYGRSLLALGDRMPPEVFVELGRALLETDDAGTAARVFARARSPEDFAGTQREIAAAWREAGRPAQAEQALRQALLTRPDDVELLLEAARLADLVGRRRRAARDFRRAWLVLVRRSPLAAEGAPATERPGTLRVRTFRSSRRNRGPDLFGRFGEAALLGRLATVEDGAGLLSEIGTELGRALSRARSEDLLGGRLDGNPRVRRLLQHLRRAALALDRPAVAGRWDRRVLAAFPEDAAARREAVLARVRSGLWEAASALATDLGVAADEELSEIVLHRALEEPEEAVAALLRKPVAVEVAARLVPGLALAGRPDLARRLLGAARPPRQGLGARQATAVLGSALLLEEREALADWALAWVRSSARIPQTRRLVDEVAHAVRRSCRVLDAAGRRRVGEELARLEREARTAGRAAAAVVLGHWRRKLDPGGSLEPVDVAVLARELQVLLRLRDFWELVPREQHAALFRRTATTQRRLSPFTVSALVDGYPGELPADLERAMLEVFERGLRDLDVRYVRTLVWRAAEDAGHRGFVGKMLSRVAERHPSDPYLLLWRGRELRAAGDVDAACRTWRRGLRILVEGKGPDRHGRSVVTRLLDAFDAGERDAVAEVLAELGDRPGTLVMRARLARASGRLEEAQELLERAGGEEADELLVQVLQERGLGLEAARRLGRTDFDEPWNRTRLARLHWRHHRPLTALAVLRGSPETADDLLAIAINAELGRDDRVRELLDRHVSGRLDNPRVTTGWWPRRPGAGSTTDGGQRPRLARTLDRNAWWRAAELPGGPRALERLLVVRGRDGFEFGDTLQLAQARARLLELGPDAAVAALHRALGAGRLARDDAALLVATAVEHPGRARELAGLWDLLLRRLVANGSWRGDGLEHVVDLRLHAGAGEELRPITRWLLIRQELVSAAPGQELLRPLELHLRTFATDARREELARWLGRRVPTGLETPAELAGAAAFEMDALRQAGDAEGAAAARRRAAAAVSEDVPLAEQRRLLPRLARDAARETRPDDYDGLVVAALELPSRTRPSAAALLPDPDACPDPLQVAAVLRRRMASADERRGARRLATIGAWLARAGEAAAAVPLLEAAEAAPTEVVRDRLNVADAWRAAGRPGRALEIELDLLRAGHLAPDRWPDVLEALAREDGGAADALALGLADETEHPAVLERAIRAARRAGRDDDAARWHETLEAVTREQ